MAQLITCPECKKPLQVPEELLGKMVQCPECKQTFTASTAKQSDSSPGAVEPKPTQTSSKSKKTRRKSDDRDDDDDDDRDDELDIGRGSGRRGEEKPGKVQAIGVMMLIGGITAILVSLVWPSVSVGMCCLWPGTYYSLVLGILAIVRGSALLGGSAHQQTVPSGIAVMMIINIINLDVVTCTLGIIAVIFCNDEEVTNYLAK